MSNPDNHRGCRRPTKLMRLIRGGCLLAFFGVGACANLPDVPIEIPSDLLKTGSSAALSDSDIVDGLKEALKVGSEHVVGQLGQQGGFSADKLVYIALPDEFQKVRELASKVGMDGSFKELELKMNRAAELATPKARKLFADAISQMSVADGRKILTGPDDAATQYFRAKTGDKLAAQMAPIVRESLSESGVYQYYRKVEAAWRVIPGASSLNPDLEGHVVQKGMDGMFLYLAKEEKAIREDPLKRTTALLRKVFAAQ